MSLFNFFKRNTTSAPVARERLQVLLAHERTVVGGESDLVAILREEIMAVIAKHMAVPQDNVHIKMDRGASVSTLEVDIQIPMSSITGMRPAA